MTTERFNTQASAGPRTEDNLRYIFRRRSNNEGMSFDNVAVLSLRPGAWRGRRANSPASAKPAGGREIGGREADRRERRRVGGRGRLRPRDETDPARQRARRFPCGEHDEAAGEDGGLSARRQEKDPPQRASRGQKQVLQHYRRQRIPVEQGRRQRPGDLRSRR